MGRGEKVGREPHNFPTLIAARKIKVTGEEELPVSRQLCLFPEAEILCLLQGGIRMERDPRRRPCPLEFWDQKGATGKGRQNEKTGRKEDETAAGYL